VVAHRAGNELDLLRATEAAGESFVEADVHLFHGRLEVRHLKSIGPLPLFWDRWALAAPWRPRLLLGELLAASAPSTELMLDLKGRKRRLAELVAESLAPYLPTRRLTVSARSWPLLEPFAGLPVRRMHSVGNARQLRALTQRFAGARLDAVSVHSRLLDVGTVAELRRIAAVVMTWPVNDPRHAAELMRLGVDGLISDRPQALSELVAPGAAA
jgi:glycerophosphoryl diester phosphodiesterase